MPDPRDQARAGGSLERAREPRVWNRNRRGYPETALYIGRGSLGGNPFRMRDQSDAERDRVCDAYEEWIQAPEQAELLADLKRMLRGHHLLCFCKPKRCHGDTLLRLVNE
jgi:hypothetical protein